MLDESLCMNHYVCSNILLEFLKNVAINDSVLRVLEKRFVLNYKYKTMCACVVVPVQLCMHAACLLS